MAKKKEGRKQKKMKIELTKASAFLWSLFLLFLLSWVFVLGILVGRGFLPEALAELGSPLKKLKEAVVKKEEYEYIKPKESTPFDFYERLESKKNEVKKSAPPLKEDKEPAREVTLARDESAAARVKSTPPEEKIEKTEGPSKEEIPVGLYSVQILSISDRNRAEKVTKELVDQDYDAYYYAATVNGKKTYRIMCGRFKSQAEAIDYKGKLEKSTGYRGFVSKVD